MKFLDEAKIFIASGHGGVGCVSFHREKFVEFGGPDGGNGGDGGNVYAESTSKLNTLIDYRYKQHYKAKRGHGGMGRNKTGAKGASVTLHLPIGTQILSEDKETLLYDLVNPEQQIILAKGGKGGLGNASFKSSTNRAPRYAQPGEPNTEYWIWLRLKLLADVGLVGLPNAGKSTFLSVVSAAKPKIADYPFTTLHPQLGVTKFDFVVADIPGLIEGASQGKGLGTRFLGHVERCKVLLHLVDATSENIIDDYNTIERELDEYGMGLLEKPRLLALSKIDALTDAIIEEKQYALQEYTGKKVSLISSVQQQGTDQLLGAAKELM